MDQASTDTHSIHSPSQYYIATCSDLSKEPDNSKMAGDRPNLISQALTFALDVANGRNAKLSRLIAPCLFLMDVVLCAAIIWKVPCEPLHSTDMVLSPN